MAWGSAGSGGGRLPTKLCKNRTGEGIEVTEGFPPCVLLEKVTSLQEDSEEVMGIHPTLTVGDKQCKNLTIGPVKQVENNSHHSLHFPDPKVIFCRICF